MNTHHCAPALAPDPATAALIDTIRTELAATPLATGLRPAILAAIRRHRPAIGPRGTHTLLALIEAELTGAGPLNPFLTPPTTDILVNGTTVWTDSPAGLTCHGPIFTTAAHTRRTAVRLATLCGRRLDNASPDVDGYITLGAHLVRLHALLPPLVAAPTLSLRLLSTHHTTLEHLTATGSIPTDLAGELTGLIAARHPFLITGGTGTGKTTLLAALLAHVPPTERIITVEDTRELNPPHPHLVTLTTRHANIEGAGQRTQADLVRHTLRMRPDRIIVGEIRGTEIIELLAALNTGHDGGAATLHANSPEDIPTRITALAALAGLDANYILPQFTSAIRAIIHLERTRAGRRLAALACVTPADGILTVWRAGHGPTSHWESWRRLVPRQAVSA